MHTFACISASTHTHLNMLFWLCVSMNICISYRTFWVNLEFVTFSLFTRGWQENSDQHFHKALCRCFYFAKLKLTAFFIHQTPPITHVCILCFPNPNFFCLQPVRRASIKPCRVRFHALNVQLIAEPAWRLLKCVSAAVGSTGRQVMPTPRPALVRTTWLL